MINNKTIKGCCIVKRFNTGYKDLVPGAPFAYLTVQETRCVEELMKGGTYADIAKKLSLSPRTVEFYINNIKAKFLCKKKKELICLFQGRIKSQDEHHSDTGER